MRRFALAFSLVVVSVLSLAPVIAIAQDVAPPEATLEPVVTSAPDPILLDVVDLVKHAKLGRTVLALVLGLKLVVVLLQRFGGRLPGAVGLWLRSPMAAGLLPMAAGVLGGVVTTIANGGNWLDGLIGGVLVGVGAWLPTPGVKPEPVPAMTTAQAVTAFNSKGPNP